MSSLQIETGEVAAANGAKRLLVVIPTHGRSTLLKRTLLSLMACDLPADVGVALVVVENCADGEKGDAEAQLVALNAPFDAYYRFHPEGNKSAALNMVIKEFCGDFVVFLDDDVRLDRRFLIAYADALKFDAGGAFYGGGVEVDYEQMPPIWLRRYLPPSVAGWHPDFYESRSGVAFLGCNWAAWAHDLLAVGSFDPKYGPGSSTSATGQEGQMQQRLRHAGLEPRYLHDAVVWHYVPADRCSPDWIVDRARKMAVSSALRVPAEKVGKTLCGAPLWLWRQLFIRGISWVFLVPFGQRLSFRRRFKLSESLGALSGFRQR